MSIVYVGFSISQWAGIVQENRYARKLEKDVQAKANTFLVRKRTLPDCQELKDLQSLNGQLRQWHYSKTLPYDDRGGRIIPTGHVFDYMNEAREKIAEGTKRVDAFLTVYPSYRQAASQALGDSFSDRDYPTVTDIANKFGYSLEFEDIPEPDAIRKHLGGLPQSEVDRMVKEAETRGAKRIEQAVGSLYADMADVLEKMAEKLSKPTGEEGAIFRDSLVENVVEMADRVGKLNFTGDKNLAAVTEFVQKMMSGISTDDLRHDLQKRAQTATRAAKLAEKMKSYVVK